MINRASIFANDYTQRLLLSRVNTDYYDGDGTGTLILNQYPVSTLSNLYKTMLTERLANFQGRRSTYQQTFIST